MGPATGSFASAAAAGNGPYVLRVTVPRIAIVADGLRTSRSGEAERVTGEIAATFPGAAVFSLSSGVEQPDSIPDLHGFDIIISSQRMVPAGVRVRPTQLHLCLSGRDGVAAHPPVDLGFFTPGGPTAERLYVTAGRHQPGTHVDRIVEAFRELPSRRLVVLGDGPEHARIRDLAHGHPHIMVRGDVPADELRDWFRRARACIAAGNEDWCLMALEAQACGTPVLAMGQGGALVTVCDEPGASCTGLFFDEPTPQSIRDAVDRFERMPIPPSSYTCRANAERFTSERFRGSLRAAVESAWAAKSGSSASD